QPGGSKRGFANKRTGRVIITDANPKAVNWKAAVSLVASKVMAGRPPLDGPLYVIFEFHMPRPKGHFGAKGLRKSAPQYPKIKPDVLKLARSTEDALTGIVYRDDALIVQEDLRKFYGDEIGVRIRVGQLRVELETSPASPEVGQAESQMMLGLGA